MQSLNRDFPSPPGDTSSSLYTYVYIRMYIYTHACTWTVHVHILIYTCTCVHMFLFMYTYIHSHTCTYTYTHVHIHTHGGIESGASRAFFASISVRDFFSIAYLCQWLFLWQICARDFFFGICVGASREVGRHGHFFRIQRRHWRVMVSGFGFRV